MGTSRKPPPTPISFRLRPDARPFDEQDLTRDQQAALHRTLGVLETALHEPAFRPSLSEEFLPIIEPHHWNHAVLIEGARGSGKTSVLLTLLKVLVDRWHGDDPLGCITPLNIIDLQTLPSNADLGLAVIQALEPLVSSLEQRTTKRDGTVGRPKSRDAWRRLVRGYLASTKNLDPNALAQLSAETAADQTENAHRRRLLVPRDLAEFLDVLAVEASKALKKTPLLFVLPIDDADMAPGRVLELINVVRTFRHQRLIYVLTGSEDLFFDVLKKNFREDLPPESDQADDLAAQALSKLIPPAQRFRLRPLPPAERVRQLEDILERAAVPTGPGYTERSLGSYMLGLASLQVALPPRLRQVADLKQTATARSDPFAIAQALWDQACAFDRTAAPLADSISIAQTPRSIEIDRLRIGVEGERFARYSVSTGLIAFGQPFRMNVGPGGAVGGAYFRSPEASGAALLAMSLAADDEDGFFSNTPRFLEGSPPLLVGVRPSYWVADNVEVGWPLPMMESPEGLLRLGLAWRHEVSKAARKGDQDAVDRAALTYAAIASSYGGRVGPPVPIPDSWEAVFGVASATTGGWADTNDRRRNTIAAWFNRTFILLAAPESALSANAAAALLRAYRAEFPDASVRTLFRSARRLREERVAAALRRNLGPDEKEHPPEHAGSLLLRADDESPGHPWFDEVEQTRGTRRLRGTTKGERLESELSTFQLARAVTNPAARSWRSLADYMKLDLRLRAVAASPWMSGFIRQAASDSLGKQGYAEKLLVDLWRESCARKEKPGLAGVLTLVGGRLKVLTVGGRKLSNEASPVTLRGANHITVQVKRFALFETPIGREKYIDPELSLIADLARDVVFDTRQTGDEGQPLDTAMGLPLLSVHRDGRDLAPAPWPCVNWPCAFEWDSLLETWTELADALAGQVSAYDADDDVHLVDGLALTYVQALTAIATRGTAGSRLQLAWHDENWGQLFKAFKNLERPDGTDAILRSRLHAFYEQLHLLASPESGLSDGTCRLILRAIGKCPDPGRARSERSGRQSQDAGASATGGDSRHPWDIWIRGDIP